MTNFEFFIQLREMRNNLMHCPTLELGDSEFASYETCLMNLLNIPELKNKPETHKALKSYEKVCLFVCLFHFTPFSNSISVI
jgi:hypothetical protein